MATVDIFYFIAYSWRRYGDDMTRFAEAVVKNEHPVDWLIRTRESNQRERSFAGMGITCWYEITREQYEKWEGEVG